MRAAEATARGGAGREPRGSAVITEQVPAGPNRPGTVPQTRRRDVVREMWRGGEVSDAAYLAAERWRDDQEALLGAKTVDPDMPSAPARGPVGYPARLVEASARVRVGWEAVAPDTLLVRWCVTLQGSIRSFEEDQGLRHDGTAKARLVAALERLAHAYSGFGLRWDDGR